ncbi:UNVERIFIED_CONTAM: hypothetical protein K2H54_048415, partial [Gekko kuhli]
AGRSGPPLRYWASSQQLSTATSAALVPALHSSLGITGALARCVAARASGSSTAASGQSSTAGTAAAGSARVYVRVAARQASMTVVTAAGQASTHAGPGEASGSSATGRARGGQAVNWGVRHRDIPVAAEPPGPRPPLEPWRKGRQWIGGQPRKVGSPPPDGHSMRPNWLYVRGRMPGQLSLGKDPSLVVKRYSRKLDTCPSKDNVV